MTLPYRVLAPLLLAAAPLGAMANPLSLCLSWLSQTTCAVALMAGTCPVDSIALPATAASRFLGANQQAPMVLEVGACPEGQKAPFLSDVAANRRRRRDTVYPDDYTAHHHGQQQLNIPPAAIAQYEPPINNPAPPPGQPYTPGNPPYEPPPPPPTPSDGSGE